LRRTSGKTVKDRREGGEAPRGEGRREKKRTLGLGANSLSVVHRKRAQAMPENGGGSGNAGPVEAVVTQPPFAPFRGVFAGIERQRRGVLPLLVATIDAALERQLLSAVRVVPVRLGARVVTGDVFHVEPVGSRTAACSPEP
jgi:hypothetical protein